MIELRFHEELYDGFAIDEAVKVYEPYATFTLDRAPGGYIVKVGARGEDEDVDVALVAAELANYALGKTIERSRAAPADRTSPPDAGTAGPAGEPASAPKSPSKEAA